MARKKIVRIISRLNIGGPAIHTILLSQGLNKDGYRDILICGQASESEGDMVYFAKSRNVEPVLIPELGREVSFGRDIIAFFKIYNILRRERPEIVHTHTAKAGALGRLAALFAGVPIKVHTFHGHIFDGYFSPLKASIFLWIERLLAVFTDRLIIVSERVRDEMVEKLKVAKSEKCVVIPLGLDLENFFNCGKLKGSFRKQIGVDDDVLLAGIVGRLVPIKNHKMFLDAALKTRAGLRDKKIRFVIVGDGELNDELRRYAGDIGMLEDVIFTGWIEDLAPVYADLDIVALTSLNEGTPVSLIEAMAAGKSIVATDVGGVREILGDQYHALLAARGDVNGFADRMIRLLSNSEERDRFGAYCKANVTARYSSEQLLENIKELYRTLIEERKINYR